MTDNEIRDAIVDYFQTKLNNFGGDELLEGPLDGDEDAYNRACELLFNAKLRIDWRDDDC